MSAPITKQPGAQFDAADFAQHQRYLKQLDPSKVEAWSVVEVAEEFLQPLGLGYLKQTFVDHKVTGHVLLSLDKDDLLEMQVHAVGDRIYIDNSLHDLRRHARKLERERTLWEGETPSGGIAYYKSLGEMCRYRLCCCFMKRTAWRITAQGLRMRDNPPSCNVCCSPMTNDFSDFRFLKDVDSKSDPMCLCCKHQRSIILEFDSSGPQSTGRYVSTSGGGNKVISIPHPEMTEGLVTIVKNAWSEARLVAD
eukprot:m.53800 g.53800  ORF g.53800 m.53800 type:complete len:251 (-) comp21822_c1_seq1:164-916(-)